MGVDEIYFGKQKKFITAVSKLETGNRYGLSKTAIMKPSMSFPNPGEWNPAEAPGCGRSEICRLPDGGPRANILSLGKRSARMRKSASKYSSQSRHTLERTAARCVWNCRSRQANALRIQRRLPVHQSPPNVPAERLKNALKKVI